MINYKWTILETFGNDQIINEVRFLLNASDDVNFVETEGYHKFSEGLVYKSYKETKEEDLIRWLDKDTTQDDSNIIKLNLEKQLESLKNSQKVELPWVANTFTIE